MSDTAFTEIATGLAFPEGPVAMSDGSRGRRRGAR